MSLEMQIAIGAGTIIFLSIIGVLLKFLPKRLKHEKFIKKWRELQAYCRDKTTWDQAIIEADKLLNEALKRRRFKGNRMGERMVSAGSIFTSKDEVWAAHNRVKKVLLNPELKLKEPDVKKTLVAFRQALRDLGALPPLPTGSDQKEKSQ